MPLRIFDLELSFLSGTIIIFFKNWSLIVTFHWSGRYKCSYQNKFVCFFYFSALFFQIWDYNGNGASMSNSYKLIILEKKWKYNGFDWFVHILQLVKTKNYGFWFLIKKKPKKNHQPCTHGIATYQHMGELHITVRSRNSVISLRYYKSSCV